jgi:hypothetical protein
LHLTAASTGVAVFLVYLLTMAPGMTFIDAGELAAVTHTLGIAHPTGYPTFTMLGWLWSKLPLGDGIYRMNLFSAVLCAIASGVYVHLIWLLLGLSRARKVQASRKAKARNGQGARRLPELPDDIRLLLSVFGALTIALSETFWSTSLSIEVYSLHILLMAFVLWSFAAAVLDQKQQEPARSRRLWLLFAFLFGLAFTNHMTSILFIPAFAAVFFRRFGVKADAWKRVGLAVPAFIAGLLPYLYLPLRAAASPAMNWGNPATLERIFWHVSGKQYRVWLFASGESARRQLQYFVSSFPMEFALVGLLLILPGIAFAFYRHRRTGMMLALLFVFCVFYSINYDIHDIDSYFLLAYVTAGIWSAFGLYALLAWTDRLKLPAAAAAAAVLVGIMAGVGWSRVSERGDHLVEDYTMNMFRSLKPNALIISYQWDYWASASFYYQLVEGLRPDVTVIDKELLRRSWYLKQIRRNHPEVYNRSESEIRLFLEELTKFEHDIPYDSEVIERRFNDMINSFIERNAESRPVYFTIEIEEHLAPGFTRVPEGLAFRLYRPGTEPSPDAPVWDAFSFRPFGRTGPLIDGLVGMYATMLTNRGVYLHKLQRYAQAAPYFDRALKFTPGNTTVIQWKTRNAGALQLSSAM